MVNQNTKAIEKLVENITPWLVELGAWIFAGLTGFALILLAALITVGPTEPSVIVSTVALTLTLPLNLAGILLLRLVEDLERFEDEVVQGFHDASLIMGSQFISPLSSRSAQTRRIQIILRYSLGLLTLSGLLTLTGLIAALWRVAWWIGIVFVLMAVVSVCIVILALVTLGPPESQETRERKRRYADEFIRRAEEWTQKKEEPGELPD
jgi:ABC-type multidrug transport system fused ATPase/permease subunit